MSGFYSVSRPANEPVLDYKKGSPEREQIQAMLQKLKSQHFEIPLIIAGKEVYTGQKGACITPHEKNHELAVYHKASAKEVNMAIEASLDAAKTWRAMPYEHRLSIFLKAADLLSGPYRMLINAATMLSQSKTVYQAEIDSACELADFFRFNCYFLSQIYEEQPFSTQRTWNRMQYRPLEGFVFAVTPFNFTSISGNLPCAPAICGNVCVWKPASSAVYSNYIIMRVLKEAGLPDGVINFVPGDGRVVGDVALTSPDLSAVHFTGSTETFKHMWKTVGEHIDCYKYYPKLIGETGGKDFIFAYQDADEQKLITAIVRGSFEYQGQKCSAASRVYVPASLWARIKDDLVRQTNALSMGSVEDFRNFVSAVIDQKAFDRIKSYLTYAKESDDAEIIAGGKCNDNIGYFVEPTVIVTRNPFFKTMQEEIFGPVVTIYVYEDEKFEETLSLCDQTSPYALTGAVFAKDRSIIVKMCKALEHAAGNFYINDKPTGAVVSQQPFGGARASGTNDKAGSKLNLYRFLSPMAIKENYGAEESYLYPYMEQ